MSSIGKIASSLLSIPAELTFAAANLNFDFSLVKVEAPKEFHGVRDALSQVRRDKAESGIPHITARKLGALFEHLVPPIPNLLSAYGQRVSEISSRISIEASATSKTGFGIFSSQAGPDATNIWAAATSGKGALAVQLLACMLARIWDEPQAISLWVELVERRKAEVNGNTVDGSNVAALMAAQQTFSRDQLAAWDSSARSWIKTADAERRVQQTQLMLVISNIELPVNSSGDLYDSVTNAWTSAMSAMEKLVQGIPQQIRDGAVLLAVSSWHLYPDMAVLSDVMTRVEQHDPFMDGSLLTFSVHISSATEDSSGVFWSLPMAHMRYYSPPVVAHGRLTSDTSRVSMEDFLIVVLGMVVSPWLRTFCPDTSRCCRLVCLLWNLLRKLPDDENIAGSTWLFMLSGAADRFLSATGVLSQQYSKLLSLGIRSEREFFKGGDLLQEPAFGLTSFTAILALIREEMMEDKIKLLRQIAASLRPDTEDLVIKYVPRSQWGNRKNTNSADDSKLSDTGPSFGSTPSYTSLQPDSEEMRTPAIHAYGSVNTDIQFDAQMFSQPIDVNFSVDTSVRPDPEGTSTQAMDAYRYEYASAVPLRRSAQKRSSSGAAHVGEGHHRWVVGKREPEDVRQVIGISCSGDGCECLVAGGERCICVILETLSCSQACHPGSLKCSRFKYHEEFPVTHKKAALCGSNCAICYNSSKKSRIQDLGEELRWCGEKDISHSAGYFQWEDTQNGRDTSIYTYVLGDPDSCSIYKSQSCEIERKPSSTTDGHRATIDELEDILRSPSVSLDLVHASLQRWFRDSSAGQFLSAMFFASTLYQGLPGATVSLEVLRIPLSTPIWHHLAFKSSIDVPHLPTLFSCLAMFESGRFHITPLSLEGVMAMSSYDSIFVASALMSDSSEDTIHRPVKRVFGNMGRPEMAFMIPPADPRFKEADPGSWHLINHSPFDGQFLDSFKSTSLHLCLTEFELILDVGARGLRDRQVVLLESVITVNDKGVDLGDVDILSALESDLVVRAGPCTHVINSEKDKDATESSCASTASAVGSSLNFPTGSAGLTSLDCWDEFLDPPATSKSIFRATNNWQARLAAVAVCEQKGLRGRILPKNPCLRCMWSGGNLDDFDILIA